MIWGKWDRNIGLFYIASGFEGLRFLIPIWLIWYTRFIPMATVGLIESLGIIIAVFLEVPTGAFADIFGRRISTVIGKAGTAMSAFLIAGAGNGASLVAGIMLWNVFNTFVNGANTALVYDHLKSKGREKDYARVSSTSMAISRVGIILASFMGGFLFNVWKPLPYVMFGVTTAVEAMLWFLMKEPKLDSQRFSWQGYKKTMTDGFGAVSHSPKVRLASFIFVVSFSYAFLFREYLNYSYALDLGLGAGAQSVLFGVTGILKTIAVILAGLVVGKMAKNKVIYLYLFLFALILLPSWWAGLVGGIIIIALSEFICATAPVISNTYMHEELGSEVRATAMSFVGMFSSLVYALALWVGMYFIGIYKSPVVFTVSGGLLLLIAVYIYWMSEKTGVIQ